jgi:hypothetical protein
MDNMTDHHMNIHFRKHRTIEDRLKKKRKESHGKTMKNIKSGIEWDGYREERILFEGNRRIDHIIKS